MKKKVLKGCLGVAGAAVLAIVVYVGYVFATYYRLEDNLEIGVERSGQGAACEVAEIGEHYLVVSANIGFGAYSDDYSFFMDGGEESRARSKEAVVENVSGSVGAAAGQNPDILLLQEVDTDGTRSWHVDEKEVIIRELAKHEMEDVDYTYAQNYDSPYLFYPVLQPHGSNKAGIVTVSVMEMSNGVRRSLPIEGGVMKFLDLDRCYSKQRIKTDNGKELVVYNLHLSAYTSDPSTATNQLLLLFDDMVDEYEKGNYVIGGGDFNKDLLGNSSDYFECGELEDNWAQPIPKELVPGEIQLVAPLDESRPVPSCRNADSPYGEDSFVLTVDGFLASANVEVVEAEVVDTGFKWSDHNPVYMEFILK